MTLPRKTALMDEPLSPKTGPVKVVSIAESDDTLPLSCAHDESSRVKQFKTSAAEKRMTGRPALGSAKLSQPSQIGSSESVSAINTPIHQYGNGSKYYGYAKTCQYHYEKLLLQVGDWLHAEKAKRAATHRADDTTTVAEEAASLESQATRSHSRTANQSSDSSAMALEQLQRILEDSMRSLSVDQLPHVGASTPRRPSSLTRRRRSSARKYLSSDTEYYDGDVFVPSCDVILDNSKTMLCTDAVLGSSLKIATQNTSKRAGKELEAWLAFKGDILKLAHTLRLKGWRRVPLEQGRDIEVERLSGALTNAVYVVSPPPLPTDPEASHNTSENPKRNQSRKPSKVLLRIYGPQVEHLIDRENELSILRRLARKKIGPRMLGTFTNGRFEEFFNAKTLTAEELRLEDTSKQIAKRMRELHDGVELLEWEREEGASVWRNWDKWVDPCERIITFLDDNVRSQTKRQSTKLKDFVCGVEWPRFKAAVDKYRKWLDDFYGKDGVADKLVFAHNDTQYGNILRLVPEHPSDNSAPSPLLRPANTHKQLVVIDFEYASANTPGLEFANHFTEWCYNYHDLEIPWACDTSKYPTKQQQTQFVKSYVSHRSQFTPHASATPQLSSTDGTSRGSIGEFLLDSRTSGKSTLDLGNAALDYTQEEIQRELDTNNKVQEILKEVQIWRVANSAQWVAWGIVQAKVPALDVEKGYDIMENESNQFDYLAYAADRALFFWGDLVSLGIVQKKELPIDLVARLKMVDLQTA